MPQLLVQHLDPVSFLDAVESVWQDHCQQVALCTQLDRIDCNWQLGAMDWLDR